VGTNAASVILSNNVSKGKKKLKPAGTRYLGHCARSILGHVAIDMLLIDMLLRLYTIF
jgi:hypothetical protein